MNEMNLLEEFCATVPPPGPDRLRPARAALLAAASTRAPRTTRTRKLAFGAVTTAAATAAALVLTLAAPFGGSSLTPPANAAVLLQRAAKAALDRPAAAAGQYIYTEVTGPASGPPSSGHGAPTTVMTVMRTWQSVNGLKQGVIESQGTCGLLDTEQAGELPGESAPQLSARGATSRAAMIAPASLPARSASCNATIGGTPTSPPASTYQGLETLPTDPGALLSYLAAHYRPMLFPGQTMSRAAREYEAIGDILENLGVLPGTLESAMFQALQQLPGMTVVQDVTDYAGRHGHRDRVGKRQLGVRADLQPGHVSVHGRAGDGSAWQSRA
jgi:hypothetical protein